MCDKLKEKKITIKCLRKVLCQHEQQKTALIHLAIDPTSPLNCRSWINTILQNHIPSGVVLLMVVGSSVKHVSMKSPTGI